jgi:hypothetical protein
LLKRVAVAVAVVGALVGGPLGLGRALAGQNLTAMTNADRVSRGLRALSTAGDLQSLAQQRSDQMARSGVLAHTVNLGSKVSGWQRLGENVGRGPTLQDIETAFMNSPEHRQNILDPAYTQLGVGVTFDGVKYFWVAVIFRQPSGAAAAAPAPAPVPKVAAAPKPAPKPAPRPAATTTTRPPTTTTTVPPTTTTTAPPPPVEVPPPVETTTTTTAPRPIYTNPNFLAANFAGESAAAPLATATPRRLPAVPVTVAFAGVFGVGTATGATAVRRRRLRMPRA